MRYAPIERVLSRLKSDFEIDMDKWEAVEPVVDALRKLALVPMHRKLLVATVKDGRVALPPEVENVNYVYHIPTITYRETGSFLIEGVGWSHEVFNTEEDALTFPMRDGTRDVNIPDRLPSYELANYTQGNGELLFDFSDKQVLIGYTAIMTGQDQLPLIPNHCVDACTMWLLYRRARAWLVFKKIDYNHFKEIELWKDKAFAQARNKIPNRNKMNEYLDVAHSFDRKRYNFDK